MQDDRVVEIHGDPRKIHHAVELVIGHLRKFLVDRSVLPLFEYNVRIFIPLVCIRDLVFSQRTVGAEPEPGFVPSNGTTVIHHDVVPENPVVNPVATAPSKVIACIFLPEG